MVEKYKILSQLPSFKPDPEIPKITNLTLLNSVAKSNIQKSDLGNDNESTEREKISSLIIQGNHIQVDTITSSQRNILDQLESKRTDVIYQGDNMQTALKDRISDINPDIDHMICILRASQDLILIKLMRKRLALVQGIEPGKKFFYLNQLEEFQNCGSLFIKINGISIEDVINKENVHPLEPTTDNKE